jgi:DNA-binding CsgD family transcriptional regulator
VTGLQEQERRVLSLLARGLTQRQAADWLGISVRTVRRRAADAVQKLGARRLPEAIAVASARGVLIPEDTDIPRSSAPPRQPGKRAGSVPDTAWQAILDDVRAGTTVKDASARYNVNYQTVYVRARRDPVFRAQLSDCRKAGRASQRPTPAVREALLTALADGVGIGQALQRVGIPRRTYRQACDRDVVFRADVEWARAVGVAVRLERFLDVLRQGATIGEAMTEVDIPPSLLAACKDRDPSLAAKIKQARQEGRAQGQPWMDPLLAELRRGTPLKLACRTVGITPSTVYEARKYPDIDQEIRAAVDAGRERKHVSRWRKGARDATARKAHNADDRRRRRAAVRARFAPVEKDLLKALASGTSLTDAVQAAGLPVQALFQRARWDKPWSDRLDAALMAGRDRQINHGTAWAYKHHRCRCPECRQANDRSRTPVRDQTR